MTPPAGIQAAPPAGPQTGQRAGAQTGQATGTQPTPPLLSERERQYLILIAEGNSVSRTARALHIDQTEFEVIEAGILEKLQASNRFQAVAKAIILGILHN